MADIAELKILITKSQIKDATDDLKALANQGGIAENKLNDLGNKGSKSFDKVSGSAKITSQNIGRIVQDSPYGLMGIMNNVDQLAEGFVRLRTETGGSTQKALQAIIGSLAGPSGILLGISIVGSLAVAFGDKLIPMLRGSSEGAKELDQRLKGLDQYRNLQFEIEIIGLEGLAEAEKRVLMLANKLEFIKTGQRLRDEIEKTNPNIFQLVAGPDEYQPHLNALRKNQQFEIDAAKKIEKGMLDLGDAENIRYLKLLKYSEESAKRKLVEVRTVVELTKAEKDAAVKLHEDNRKKLDDTLKQTQAQKNSNLERQKAIALELQSAGLTAIASAGAVGSMTGESGQGLNSSAYNKSSGAAGMAQWLGSRLKALKDFAASIGRDYRDTAVQIEFIKRELATTEKSVVALMNAAKSPQEAAEIWTKAYERPSTAEYNQSIGARKSTASNIYQNLYSDTIDLSKSNIDLSNSYQDIISALDDELLKMQIGEIEYRKHIEIKKAGVNVNSAEAQVIRDKIDALEKLNNVEKTSLSFEEELLNSSMEWASGLSQTFSDMAFGAEDAFSSIIDSFKKMVAELIIQYYIIKPLLQSFNMAGASSDLDALFTNSSTAGLFAAGGVFSGGKVTAFASGGAFTNSVVSSPTLAPMAYFGEAGDEAIMPLTRIGGDLGVKAVVGGSNAPNIVFKIINNTGSKIEEKREESFDGENFVITTILSAVANNKSGTKDILKSQLKSA